MVQPWGSRHEWVWMAVRYSPATLTSAASNAASGLPRVMRPRRPRGRRSLGRPGLTGSASGFNASSTVTGAGRTSYSTRTAWSASSSALRLSAQIAATIDPG